MGNYLMAFLIVIGINLMLWLGQAAVLDINPSGTTFGDYQGNMFGKTNEGNTHYQLNESDPYGMLPKGNSAIDPDTGNIFTDAYNTIKGWLADKTGARYLMAIVSAPYNFLKALHLPEMFVYAFGTFWYLLTILISVLMLTGRDNS